MRCILHHCCTQPRHERPATLPRGMGQAGTLQLLLVHPKGCRSPKHGCCFQSAPQAWGLGETTHKQWGNNREQAWKAINSMGLAGRLQSSRLWHSERRCAISNFPRNTITTVAESPVTLEGMNMLCFCRGTDVTNTRRHYNFSLDGETGHKLKHLTINAVQDIVFSASGGAHCTSTHAPRCHRGRKIGRVQHPLKQRRETRKMVSDLEDT